MVTTEHPMKTECLVLSAVLGVLGVTNAYVTENSSNVQVDIGGVLLAPNSLYVAVVGGDETDVRQAIESTNP